jgi:hypothetical protein
MQGLQSEIAATTPIANAIKNNAPHKKMWFEVVESWAIVFWT